MKLSKTTLITATIILGISSHVIAKEYSNKQVSDDVISQQREKLSLNTAGKNFGPQSPRDLNSIFGLNFMSFTQAPKYQNMNLCNIHFHKNAEHKGGEFNTYAGNGNGNGIGGGYEYNGVLKAAELKPVSKAMCPSKKGALQPGDTIEVHYVHSSANVTPGPTLGACLSPDTKNPFLRVETQVYVLSSNTSAAHFGELTKLGVKNGYQQAVNIPNTTGEAITYAGSTTGPSYNEKASPFNVTWNVRPKVMKVDINSVGDWCEDNVFEEDHAHAVRNLVTNPDLLSQMELQR